MKTHFFKVLVLIIAIFGSSFVLKKYEASKELAKVDRVEGVYVYVMSEPTMDYDVIGTVNAGKGNAKWGMKVYTVEHYVENLIKKANKMDDVKGNWDAIITEDGWKGTLIKLK